MKLALAFTLFILTVSSVLADDLPNPSLTPGRTNPDVTPDTLASTICQKGWASTQRPPSSYTTALKVQQLRSLGGDQNTADYEEDHLISIELGGHTSDPANLWPEHYSEPWGARTKDRLENRLNFLACKGARPLAELQNAIATNWLDAYKRRCNPASKCPPFGGQEQDYPDDTDP